MSMLRFRCPRTGREVDSGIDADSDSAFMLRLFSVRVRCPICEDLHEWRTTSGRLHDFPDHSAQSQRVLHPSGDH